jgi:hypothetical protein
MSAPIHVIWLDLWNSEPICDRTVATMVESSAAKKVPIHRAPKMTNLARASNSLGRAYPCTPIDEGLPAISAERFLQRADSPIRPQNGRDRDAGRACLGILLRDCRGHVESRGGGVQSNGNGTLHLLRILAVHRGILRQQWSPLVVHNAFSDFQTVGRDGTRRRLRNLRSAPLFGMPFP